MDGNSEPGLTVAGLRQHFDAGLTLPAAFRRGQLTGLRRMLRENGAALADALHQDLGKPALESRGSELYPVDREIGYALRRLSGWMAERRVAVPLALRPARARVHPRPLGVVLVIAPWNYPVQLLLAPLVGALAAGNCAVLKPSELAPATAELLQQLVPRYLDPRAVAVRTGGPDAAAALVAQRFDHIFYSGGERVGRMVLEAAALRLTPVTLELGGKSPAVVLDGHWPGIARRLVHGKFLNTGQTCVAPDYVLAVGSAAAPLEAELPRAIGRFFGPDPRHSSAYGRIVDDSHFDRLSGYLAQGTVLSGGGSDRAARYLEPTVLTGVDPASPVMQEEIFGPVLPVLRVPDLAAAMAFINARPTPLAAYLFSEQARQRRLFEDGVRAGAVGHNVCNVQLLVPGLPFGGSGASGMGRYHGQYSFETFSQLRPVFTKPTRPDTLSLGYPPYTRLKTAVLKRLL